MRPTTRNQRLGALLFVVLTLAIYPLLAVRTAYALILPSRSIMVSPAEPSAVATHTFQFTYASTLSIGSVVFEYCDNSPLFDEACNPPPGVNALTASLVSQSGETSFSIDGVNTTSSRLVITRAPAATGVVASSYSFGGITNPSTPGTVQFVRISTRVSSGGRGPEPGRGAVPYAFLPPFQVGLRPPTVS